MFLKHQCFIILTCDVLNYSFGHLSLHPKYNQNKMQSYPNLKQNKNSNVICDSMFQSPLGLYIILPLSTFLRTIEKLQLKKKWHI
jgi:hypothetical protein